MEKVKSLGACRVCGVKFSKNSITNHLRSCLRKAEDSKKASGKKSRARRALLIVVTGSPYHWMHLQASADATLYDLDDFLRETWLECCGHGSDFEIEGVRYSGAAGAGWSDFGDEDMDIGLGEVLRKGLKFSHTYDYGSTTQLELRVAAEMEAQIGKRSINIQARNDPPEFPCSECGEPAVHVCTECIWSGDGWLCDDCLSEHECGDDMALPLVNSPRVGICGYTGES